MYRKFLKGVLLGAFLTVMLTVSASAATIGGATVTGSSVRLRSGADTSTTANVITEMNQGTFLLVEEKLDGWYKVAYNGVEGYVSADYASFSEMLDGTYSFAGAQTVGTGINLRSGASTEVDVVKNIPDSGTKLTIVGVCCQWLKVTDAAGATGYIRSDYVHYAGAEAQLPSQTAGTSLVATAKNYLGYSYRWGGMSPATGFDCSGFVNYIYDQYGYDLDRTAQQIYSNNGSPVSKDSLQPGDVLCFGYGSKSISHVGIYIGDGQMVHASTSTTGVITSDINSDYYSKMFVGAKRILE